MPSSKKPIFHVGFPKAGSTTLQKLLFMRHPGLVYAGIYPESDLRSRNLSSHHENAGPNNQTTVNSLMAMLFKTDGFSYDPEYARVLAAQVLSQRKDGRPLRFSSEAATGCLHSFPDVIAKARRLKEVFGSLRVVIVIREQIAIIKSTYRKFPQDPRLSYCGDVVTPERWVALERTKRYFRSLDVIDYSVLLATYSELFGKENVLVLPLDMLFEDREGLGERFSVFCGVDPSISFQLLGGKQQNQGVSTKFNRYRRLRTLPVFRVPVPRWVPAWTRRKVLDWLHRGAPEKIVFPESVIAELRGKYAAGNTAIEKDRGVDLRRLGYATLDSDL